MKKTSLILMALLLFPAICLATYNSGMTNITAAGTIPVSNDFSTFTIVNPEIPVEITNYVTTTTVVGGAINISNWTSTVTVINGYLPVEIINQTSTVTLVSPNPVPVSITNYVTTMTVTDTRFSAVVSTGTAGKVTDIDGTTVITTLTGGISATGISFISRGGDSQIQLKSVEGIIYVPEDLCASVSYDVPNSTLSTFQTDLAAGATVYYIIRGVK